MPLPERYRRPKKTAERITAFFIFFSHLDKAFRLRKFGLGYFRHASKLNLILLPRRTAGQKTEANQSLQRRTAEEVELKTVSRSARETNLDSHTNSSCTYAGAHHQHAPALSEHIIFSDNRQSLFGGRYKVRKTQHSRHY